MSYEFLIVETKMKFSTHLGDGTSDMLLNQLISQPYQIEEKHKPMIKKTVKRPKQMQNKKGQAKKNQEAKNDLEDMKSHNADEERRKQFKRVEEQSSHNEIIRQREASHLKEAIILAEIIGQPRCRSRQNRRIRRG